MRPYRLIRSDRRTLSLGIDPSLEVIVRAPHRLSKKAIDDFVASHEAWIGEHIRQQAERSASQTEVTVTAQEEKQLREEARARMGALLETWAPRMGVEYTRMTITGARTRWGSCSGKNSISFSWRVMLLPQECREYVAVHELAHIRQHNHSAAFYREIGRVMPDYRAREETIRRFSKENHIVTE